MALEADVGNIINLKIARRLDEVAQILSGQGANPYRVQAYQKAAANLRRLGPSVVNVFEKAVSQHCVKYPGSVRVSRVPLRP